MKERKERTCYDTRAVSWSKIRTQNSNEQAHKLAHFKDRRVIHAYKLIRVRRDGTLGPLFIGRDLIIDVGVWLEAEPIRVKGFKFRPGWHACSKKSAPHLSKKGRVWCKVSLFAVEEHHRPKSQGGLWYTAMFMRVDKVLG